MIPDFLLQMLKKQYDEKSLEKILEGYKSKRKVTLRVNTLKSSIDNIKLELEKNNINFEIVPWSKEALIINNVEEAEIEKLDIYEKGEIYLQSLSSMLPPIILEPKEGEDILDMTAAPRWKNNSNSCNNFK